MNPKYLNCSNFYRAWSLLVYLRRILASHTRHKEIRRLLLRLARMMDFPTNPSAAYSGHLLAYRAGLLILFATWLGLSPVMAQATLSPLLQRQVDTLTGPLGSRAPEAVIREIDGLLVHPEVRQSPEASAKLLRKQLHLYAQTLQHEAALTVADRLLPLTQRHGLSTNRADDYLTKSTVLARLGRTEEVLVLLDSVLMYNPQAPQKEQVQNLIQVYYLRARINDRKGQLRVAMDDYLRAIHLAKTVDDTRKLLDLYFNLGYIHKALQNYPETIRSHEQSLTYARQRNDTSYQVYNHVFLAGVHLIIAEEHDTSDPQDRHLNAAHEYLQTAIDLTRNRDEPAELELLYFELSNYYEALADYERAVALILDSRAESDRTQNYESILAGYDQLADCYTKMGRYRDAIAAAQRGLQLADEIGAYYYHSDLNRTIAEAAARAGDPEMAVDFYKKYVAVRDSVFKAETARQVTELQTQYETQEREQQILELDRERERQKLALRNARYFIGLAVVIGLLLIALVWFFFRQRALVERLERQRAQLRWRRAQLNPHFFFNALSGLQTLVYEQKTPAAVRYISGFSRLLRGQLEASNRDEHSLEEELAFLTNYLELERLSLDFTYRVTLEPPDLEVSELLIPTMLLQPFVENALEHGLRKSTKPDKRLDLSIREVDDHTLKVSIRDNGAGRQQQRRSRHISRALEITDDRKKLLRGAFDYRIVDHTDAAGQPSGTEVVFTIRI